MKKTIPSSITIEAAVARLVNMDDISSDFTLLDMTAAFLEEAEVEYENARLDQLPEVEMIRLEIRMMTCKARHELAQLLLECLQFEVDNPEGSMIVVANDSSSQCRITSESVSDWAIDRYGIGISEINKMPEAADINSKRVLWEDITFKIKQDYMIEWYSKGNAPKYVHFKDVGLMGKKADKPNKEGRMLIWLNMQDTQIKAIAEGKERISMYRLNNALRKLTGLSGEPFQPYNKAEGWKARFKLKTEEFETYNSDYIWKQHKSFDENIHHNDKEFDFDDPIDEILASHRIYDDTPSGIDYEFLKGIAAEQMRRR